MKTTDLLPPELDYWVAKAEKLEAMLVDQMLAYKKGWQLPPKNRRVCYLGNEKMGQPAKYQPSTDWEQGGPLIEEYEMDITFMEAGRWRCMYGYHKGHLVTCFGNTPLIAANRAIVASVYGEEVSNDR